MQWQHFWIDLSAPVLGMLAGAQLFLAVRGARRTGCAKLLHPPEARCIHCGYEPARAACAAVTASAARSRRT
jgi:aquaporin Z